MAKQLTFTLAPWQHWSKLKPEEVAIILDDRILTWRELGQEIDKLTRYFGNKSVVALLCNPIEHFRLLLCLLAAWERNVATLLINNELCQDLIDKILQQTAIELLSFSNPIIKAGSQVPFDFNKVLSLTLTSGSTGLPKAVAHNALQHLYSAKGLFSIMPFQAKDTWLLSLPLYHISGLAIVWRWLMQGAKLKIANYKGEALIKALEGVTHASLVPTQLQRLIEHKSKLSLQSVLLGGAAIPKALVGKAQKQGIDCWCGYGMTEMGSTINAKCANDIDSVGKILPFREIKIAKNQEILVKGKTLALGYFIQGKLQPLALNWFATKDLGRWLENGELIIKGRLDNMFISGGENIQPEEIEKVLSQFPAIGQVMVLPQANKKWGQIPVALIENTVDTKALLDFAKSHLTLAQMPKDIFNLPAVFLQSGIKPSRAALALWLAKKRPDEK